MVLSHGDALLGAGLCACATSTAVLLIGDGDHFLILRLIVEKMEADLLLIIARSVVEHPK